jgi:hypothetical protein
LECSLPLPRRALLRAGEVAKGETQMDAFLYISRVAIAAIIIVAVSELSKQYPRYGALLLSLPIVSILAFTMSWFQHHDLPAIAKLAKETIILVLLGLPFFLSLMLSHQTGLSFWPSLAIGILLASLTTGAWLLFAPGD